MNKKDFGIGEREIKFRAWMDCGEWINDDTEQKREMVYDIAYEDYEPVNDLLNRTEYLMQYTGLKDKNGKEIYEGDVVIVTDPPANGLDEILHKPVVVAWNDELSGFSIGYISSVMTVYLDYEVIGNCFENPELIESK